MSGLREIRHYSHPQPNTSNDTKAGLKQIKSELTRKSESNLIDIIQEKNGSDNNNHDDDNNNGNPDDEMENISLSNHKVSAFVNKLYQMLDDPSLNNVIRWSRLNEGDDSTFALIPGLEFANVLTNYFKHGNVASFVRQLHMYGFHKVGNINCLPSMDDQTKTIWEFRHASGKFKKDDKNSLHLIKRRSTSSRNTSLTHALINTSTTNTTNFINTTSGITTTTNVMNEPVQSTPAGDQRLPVPNGLNNHQIDPNQQQYLNQYQYPQQHPQPQQPHPQQVQTQPQQQPQLQQPIYVQQSNYAVQVHPQNVQFQSQQPPMGYPQQVQYYDQELAQRQASLTQYPYQQTQPQYPPQQVFYQPISTEMEKSESNASISNETDVSFNSSRRSRYPSLFIDPLAPIPVGLTPAQLQQQQQKQIVVAQYAPVPAPVPVSVPVPAHAPAPAPSSAHNPTPPPHPSIPPGYEYQYPQAQQLPPGYTAVQYISNQYAPYPPQIVQAPLPQQQQQQQQMAPPRTGSYPTVILSQQQQLQKQLYTTNRPPRSVPNEFAPVASVATPVEHSSIVPVTVQVSVPQTPQQIEVGGSESTPTSAVNYSRSHTPTGSFQAPNIYRSSTHSPNHSLQSRTLSVTSQPEMHQPQPHQQHVLTQGQHPVVHHHHQPHQHIHYAHLEGSANKSSISSVQNKSISSSKSNSIFSNSTNSISYFPGSSVSSIASSNVGSFSYYPISSPTLPPSTLTNSSKTSKSLSKTSLSGILNEHRDSSISYPASISRPLTPQHQTQDGKPISPTAIANPTPVNSNKSKLTSFSAYNRSTMFHDSTTTTNNIANALPTAMGLPSGAVPFPSIKSQMANRASMVSPTSLPISSTVTSLTAASNGSGSSVAASHEFHQPVSHPHAGNHAAVRMSMVSPTSLPTPTGPSKQGDKIEMASLLTKDTVESKLADINEPQEEVDSGDKDESSAAKKRKISVDDKKDKIDVPITDVVNKITNGTTTTTTTTTVSAEESDPKK